MKEFNFKILSPDRVIFEGKCTSLVFDAPDGKYGILADHSPVISAVSEGELTVTGPSGTQAFTLPGGILRFENNEGTVVVS